MTSAEYLQHMNRLLEQFGKGAYSQTRAELIWREVKNLSGQWWEKTVDHLLLTCRQAPLQPEIGPLISEERERMWRAEQELKAKDRNPEQPPQANCPDCKDRGLLSVWDSYGNEGIARCSCEAGKRKSKHFITYQQQP